MVWWAIGLSAAVVLCLWLLTQSTITSVADAAAERSVDVDLAGLVDIYASGGNAELVKRIEDRLALTLEAGNAPHYMLATNEGKRLAGNIATWPGLQARMSEAGEIPLANGGVAFARATQIGPDLKLLVAREHTETDALQRRIAVVFLGGGIALIIAVGLLGKMAAQGLSSRIVRVNSAFRNPRTERLAELSEDQHRDEIDELTSRSAQAISRMKRLMEAHRETSDQIAHEIRTPLMHIDSKLVKALRELDGIGPVAGLVAASRDDLRRLVAMLESLLDIASSKARQGDKHGLKPVDLSELVTRVGELYADSAEESGHVFECRVAPDVTIEGEEMQLTRLVTNLLDNAFKYVPAGGSVLLALEQGPKLIVQDDGPGIAKHQREAVFERFKRATNDGASGQGAGLGLSLARAIAERHGLTLTLTDSVQGACFVLEYGDDYDH